MRGDSLVALSCPWESEGSGQEHLWEGKVPRRQCVWGVFKSTLLSVHTAYGGLFPGGNTPRHGIVCVSS